MVVLLVPKWLYLMSEINTIALLKINKLKPTLQWKYYFSILSAYLKLHIDDLKDL